MIKYFIAALLPLGTWAQGITITPGASLVLNGSALLTLQDAGLTNNGNLSAGNSTILFSGTTATANSFIGGSSSTSFNNITLIHSSNVPLLTHNISFNYN